MILSNDKANETIRLDEKSHVEEPFLAQLEGLGWTVLRLDKQQAPADSFRADFGDVVLIPKLQEALRKINPFLTEEQVTEVVQRITSFQSGSLIENNQKVLDLLLQNTSVSTNYHTGEPSPTVRYIDFKNRTNNSFIAISQLKIRIPATEHHIVPDIILFINGLPIAVVECKSSRLKEPIAEAIDQLTRYSQQRGEGAEGNRTLFYYIQFLVATCRNLAKVGTITTRIEKHWFRWTDPYPFKLDDLPHEGTSPNDQQRLVAGMLSKDNLLDLIQSFTILGVNDKGQTIKIVGRYQQFRAVKLAIKRLLAGQNRRERSGIIWHTQGSGKSLTMMFMVREMHKDLALGNWKIVFVTDRTDLEDQLSQTTHGAVPPVKIAEWINPDPQHPGKSLKELLANDTPDLVMVMIQKFQERDLHETFPVLNTSPNILIMIDEAHRSQYKLLGANLDRALPNASRIAYTGTPIDRTEQTFGDYIDKYTMRESVADGTTLQIVYEGRTQNAEVTDQTTMDKRFADVFSDYNLGERLQILGYGSRDAYLEAEDVIRDKARDMIDHYVAFVFPGGFKAQVVATSREAALRYKTHLDAALKDKIAALEHDNPTGINLELVRTLETAVVISGSTNDRPYYRPYTEESYHTRSIRRFKMPFNASEGEGAELIDGRVGIVVVQNMLLTGFDAPIEQVLYLDRVMIAHNLLQAIARVNRVGEAHKDKGFVVDYVGVGNNLKRALDSYAERERQEILDTLGNDQQNQNDLIQADRQIWELLKKNGLTDFTDPDAFFDLFYDEDIRFEYILAFQKLTRALNLVFPAKEALDYLPDYENFAEINALAERHLHDHRLSMRGIPDKLRGITDVYLKSQGISQKVAPISILDADFQKGAQAHKRDRTKAAEVEHAIRHYIELNIDEDPELFASFAEALEKILQEFKDNWNRVYQELEKLRQRMVAKEKEETYGLDRKKQMPIFRIFKAELYDNRALNEDEIAQDVDLTQNTFNLIHQEIQTAGFWNSIPAQNRLKAEIQDLFVSERFVAYPNLWAKRKELISRLMEWAKENNGTILRD